jgi:hypothetical protein
MKLPQCPPCWIIPEKDEFMNACLKLLGLLLLVALAGFAADPSVLVSTQAKEDVPLQLDPNSPFWGAARPVFMDKDSFGKTVPRYRTEVRTRWTKKNLYFLFTCPYEQLHLKPNPNTTQETNELWNWDVAEVFIGSDFADIKRYKEFEVSPQGEWVDLDINLHNPHHEDGWTWNSEFEARAKIDQEKHLWYAAMRIPLSAIDLRPPAAGNKLRINLFRSQGPPDHHQEITWQPTLSKTFHVPERFGLIRLAR